MTTQDLVKGIDISGLTNVTASELMQLVDTGRLAEDKGMVIETTDTAIDTPLVPNPNNDYSGVIPTYWTKYIWRRLPFEGEDTDVKNYIWNPNAEEDEILLFWEFIDKDGKEAIDLANTAITDSAAALAQANTALSNANISQITADNAQARIDVHEDSINLIQITLQQLEELQSSLWGVGDIKYTCKSTIFSSIENQGWVECDGSDIDRVVFSDLFAAIGVTWGNGDGTTTFTLPDFRGRALIGSGTGAGLTARNLGLTNGGAETHLLTALESGLPAHHHILNSQGSGGGITNVESASNLTGALIPNNTTDVAAAPAVSAHNNMMPFGVARIIMKC